MSFVTRMRSLWLQNKNLFRRKSQSPRLGVANPKQASQYRTYEYFMGRGTLISPVFKISKQPSKKPKFKPMSFALNLGSCNFIMVSEHQYLKGVITALLCCVPSFPPAALSSDILAKTCFIIENIHLCFIQSL